MSNDDEFKDSDHDEVKQEMDVDPPVEASASEGSGTNNNALEDFEGLPPLPNDDEDDEFEDDYDGVETPHSRREMRKRKREAEDDEKDNEDEDDDDDDDDADIADDDDVNVPGRKRRNKKKGPFVPEMVYVDEQGKPCEIIRDEIIIPNEDPKASEKVDADGYLQGGRVYRNRTFTVMNLGKQLFMLSTEPARLVGFRDSYLLFKTHPHTLYKKICTSEEKQDLIERGLLPNSYKGRAVNLVTARTIYREFGARMIRDGKKVVDDFWEQRAIDNGDVSGEAADPGELYRTNQYIGGYEVPTNETIADIPAAAPVPQDKTWLHLIALQAAAFNKRLMEDRGLTFTHGTKDLNTNLVFYPSRSQPTKSHAKRVGDNSEKLEFDLVWVTKDTSRKTTGLADVPKEVFDDLEDQSAVLTQQKWEKHA